MKIGFVGCGKIARSHAAAVAKRVKGASIVFCDRNLQKAERLTKRYSPGGSAYTSLEELLREEKPDSVHVLTQPASHFDLIKAALEAGAHVYVEKPVTETAEQFDILEDIARRQQRHLYPGYSALGLPVVQHATSLVRSGRYGKLISVHCDYNWSAGDGGIPYGSGDHWAYSLKGGILQNLADHPASLVIDALDDVDRSHAHLGRRVPLPRSSPDLLHVSVSNFSQIGSLTMSFGHGNTHGYITYCLEAGTIQVDLHRHLSLTMAGRGPYSLAKRFVTGIAMSGAMALGNVSYSAQRAAGLLEQSPGVALLIENYYRVIAGGENPIVSSETARRTVDVLERAWNEATAAE